MEIESIKSAIINRVKEVHRLELERKDTLKELRERINELKEEVVSLTIQLEAAERQELITDAESMLLLE